MELTRFEHIMIVCKYHTGGHSFSDPKWGQRFLDWMERDERITADEADEIRLACGWPVQLVLL